MDDKETKQLINEYLAAEFALAGEDDPADDKWPFELEYVGTVDDTSYYRFDDFGEVYYASISPALLCYHQGEKFEKSPDGEALLKK